MTVSVTASSSPGARARAPGSTRSLADLHVDAGAAEADLHTLGGGREMQVWFLAEHLVDRPLVRPDGETGV